MPANQEYRVDIIIQGAGLIASLLGLVALIVLTLDRFDGVALAVAVIYGVSLITMFSFSLLNTLVGQSPYRPLIQTLDHVAIYFLIAGTYTPFCLMGLGGANGSILLLVVWVAALAGVALRIWFHGRLKAAVISLYVLLGWAGLVQIDTILNKLPSAGVVLLAVGGLLYTIGAPLHRLVRLRYHSAIWHGFVLGGAGCHYAAIFIILFTVRQPL
ncbi:MAG TPA: hemolysin III family protein [Rhodospirillaceae bacterium]|nr:hemolysin III family protein [Rhodospirillaceae bacterium]